MTGTVFNINEFTVHDGPGVRVTVFMKGCPLHCVWCHNPEGLSPEPQLMVRKEKCRQCGACCLPCEHEDCKPFGRCLHACPDGLVSVSGAVWDSGALAERLSGYAPLLSGGGVTFSGGEPLLQAVFVADVCQRLSLHKTLQTCGYAEPEVFAAVLDKVDFVLFDIKIADREQHKKFTGVYNDKILANYQALKASGKPYAVRVPLIPAITDTQENLAAISAIAGTDRVELMRYNPLAGAKYEMVGRKFGYEKQPENKIDLSVFANAEII